MSTSNSVVAEYLFGGPTPEQGHNTIISAIRSLIDAENGQIAYFPATSILYRFDDGSVIVVDEQGVIDYDSIDEAAEAITRTGGKRA